MGVIHTVQMVQQMAVNSALMAQRRNQQAEQVRHAEAMDNIRTTRPANLRPPVRIEVEYVWTKTDTVICVATVLILAVALALVLFAASTL